MIIDADDYDTPYMSTLWHNGKVVGETTSGAFGYRVNAAIAHAMVSPDLAVAGTKLEVDIYGTRYTCVVQADKPLWDPENERLRS